MEKAGRGLPYLLFPFRFLNFLWKKEKRDAYTSLFLVPLTGLEPVRILLRGILSPLCLPIPPQRRCFYYTTRSAICQGFFEKNLIFFFYKFPVFQVELLPYFSDQIVSISVNHFPAPSETHSTSRKNQLFYLTNQNRHAIITLLYNTVILE